MQKWLSKIFLLWELERDHSLGLNLNSFAPKLHFRLNSDMKHKVLANYLQRAHWWMMAHLEVQGRLAKKKATIFNIKRKRLNQMNLVVTRDSGLQQKAAVRFLSLDFSSF